MATISLQVSLTYLRFFILLNLGKEIESKEKK